MIGVTLRLYLPAAPAKHPQILMRELGITYTDSVAYPIGDCWLFYGCAGGPAELPDYLAPVKNSSPGVMFKIE